MRVIENYLKLKIYMFSFSFFQDNNPRLLRILNLIQLHKRVSMKHIKRTIKRSESDCIRHRLLFWRKKTIIYHITHVAHWNRWPVVQLKLVCIKTLGIKSLSKCWSKTCSSFMAVLKWYGDTDHPEVATAWRYSI